MKKMIAALHVTLDGFIEGPKGELDWVQDWNAHLELTSEVDTCVLGGGMYPGYEQYWTSILADPAGVLEFTGRPPTPGEIDYANWADQTPHVVLSTTLNEPTWKTARVVRGVEDVRSLKAGAGKDIFVVGGASLVSTLMNHELIEELRLVVHPLVLGRGKPLFKDVTDRHQLQLIAADPADSGLVVLSYRTQGGPAG
jgi:dihydrofolate reductase